MINRTRKKNKEHKLSCKSYITFVIISDPTKNPITIKIPKWIRFPILACLVAMVMWVVAINVDVADAHSSQVDAALKLQANTYENSHKDERISELEAEDAENKETLQRLSNSMNNVADDVQVIQSTKDDIDTKLNGTEKTTETQPISGTDIELKPTDSMALYNEFENTVQAITVKATAYQPVDEMDFQAEADNLMARIMDTRKLLEQEKENYDILDQKVDEMIPYWEAYPSMLPVTNTRITSPFGWRKNPFGRRSSEFHKGVDLKAKSGTSVYATGKGKVIYAGYDSIYGRLVIIDHGYGITTKYAHNSRLLVKKGDEVARGDLIARSGNTGRSSGPHVHYGVLINNEPQNPLDFIKK